MTEDEIWIAVASVGGVLVSIASLIGAVHWHSRSRCCGRKISIDLNVDKTTPTQLSPLIIPKVNEI